MSGMPLSVRSKSKSGLALSGLHWLNRRIRSGTICRESGTSLKHSGFRRASRKQKQTKRAVSVRAETQIPRCARDDNHLCRDLEEGGIAIPSPTRIESRMTPLSLPARTIEQGHRHLSRFV